jgi:hypothetical protein
MKCSVSRQREIKAADGITMDNQLNLREKNNTAWTRWSQ